MSQGPLCPNLIKKVQKEVSQMANRNLSRMILLGGLSVNLNHLIIICECSQHFAQVKFKLRILQVAVTKWNTDNRMRLLYI